VFGIQGFRILLTFGKKIALDAKEEEEDGWMMMSCFALLLVCGSDGWMMVADDYSSTVS
jgi:hypothetical protein